MEFPVDLHPLLLRPLPGSSKKKNMNDDGDDDADISVDVAGLDLKDFQEFQDFQQEIDGWNLKIESYLASSPPPSSPSPSPSSNPPSPSMIKEIARKLHDQITASAAAAATTTTTTTAKFEAGAAADDKKILSMMMILLSSSLRTAKNLLRWYLQIYVPSQRTRRQQQQQSISQQQQEENPEDPFSILKQPSMICLVFQIVVWSSTTNGTGTTTGSSSSSSLSWYASQYLFYATYCEEPAGTPQHTLCVQGLESLLLLSDGDGKEGQIIDGKEQQEQEQQGLSFWMKIMQLLLTTRTGDDSPKLVLSILRNVQNIVVMSRSLFLNRNPNRITEQQTTTTRPGNDYYDVKQQLLQANVQIIIPMPTTTTTTAAEAVTKTEEVDTTNDAAGTKIATTTATVATVAPWMMSRHSSSPSDEERVQQQQEQEQQQQVEVVDFVSVCTHIMDWSLDKIIYQRGNNNNNNSIDDDEEEEEEDMNPKNDVDINNNDNDVYPELICEILNVFYALKVGPKQLFDNNNKTSSSSNNSSDRNNDHFADVVCKILCLSSSSSSPSSSSSSSSQSAKNGSGNSNSNINNSNHISTNYKQCKLAAISLLMDDSDNSFITYLLGQADNGQNNDSSGEKRDMVIDAMLDILSNQVQDVVDNTRVDQSATASLVPVQVVMNKYCSIKSNQVFLNRVKSSIFPADSEQIYQQNVERYVNNNQNGNGSIPSSLLNTNSKTKANNMSPLMDVPKTTLRGRLVVLLSWPESYIKRCTAEFMWTLVNADAEEYVHRVGMGNAMPLLMAKGFVPIQIPP